MTSTSKAEFRIAALLTCFNRKDKTLACLDRVYNQDIIDKLSLEIFLVDDGSEDGTSKAVKDKFPDVNVIPGTGDLFWGGGMRLAFNEAMKEDVDYYWWLNDDSMIFPTALKTMLGVFNSVGNRPGIVVGSMRDERSGVITYGGRKKTTRFLSVTFKKVLPGNQPLECDAVNGNCVLISAEVVRSVGNISKEFTHGIGDFDYSLRAKKLGFSCWVSPGYAGTCSLNPAKGSYLDKNLSKKERIEKMNLPTRLPPPKEWMVYTRRHFGWRWPIYWVPALLRMRFPSLWIYLKSR